VQRRQKAVKFLVLAAALLFAAAVAAKTLLGSPGARVDFGRGAAVKVEVASTPEQKERGLSGRSGLPAGEGMLFAFDKEQKPAFWMKDMLFSIDIIWMDKSGEIVDISQNLSPSSYPETFTPKKPAAWVLEVNAGFAKEHNLSPGQRAAIKL